MRLLGKKEAYPFVGLHVVTSVH